MVKLNKVIKEEIKEVVNEKNQDHIQKELEKLFKNMIELNYDEQDIIDIINRINISEEETGNEY